MTTSSIKDELAEMEAILLELRTGARDLLSNNDSNAPKSAPLTKEIRIATAKSSWARSNAPRIDFLKNIKQDTGIVQEISPRNSGTISSRIDKGAGYTMSKAKVERITVPKDLQDAAFYDINADASSTRKRCRSAKIPKESDTKPLRTLHATASLVGQTRTISSDHNNPPQTDDSMSCSGSGNGKGNGNGSPHTNSSSGRSLSDTNNQDRRLKKQNKIDIIPKSYGFAKSSRKILSVEAPITANQDALDVERGEKFLRTNTVAVIIHPPPKEHQPPPSRTVDEVTSTTSHDPMNIDHPSSTSQGNDSKSQNQSSHEQKDDNSYNSDNNNSNQRLDQLSNHPRTPTVTLYHKPHKVKRNLALPYEKPVPGPGAYDVVHVGAITAILETDKGVVYREKKPLSDAERAAAIAKPVEMPLPGPGYYDTESAETFLRQSTSSAIIRQSEPKATPQMKRRKYFEDKAKDAREEHDDMREASDSLLKPRTPSIVIASDKKVGVNWKNRQILRERAAEEERIRQLAYDVEYGQVEQRPQVRVNMAQEVAVKESLHKRFLEKPGLAEVEAAKFREKTSRDRFLGPHLQVPWVYGANKGPGMGVGVGVGTADETALDDGEESPTEEVMAILRRRGGMDVHDNAAATAKDELFDDTTAAYLKSSYSGALSKREAAATMRIPMPHEERNPDLNNISMEFMNRDYLEPQLPIDWKAEGEARKHRHKNPAAKLNLRPGRESITIKRKGDVRISEFDKPIEAYDSMGPGVYDVMAGRAFGEGVSAPDFNTALTREQVIGPDGERPDGIVQDENEMRMMYGDELIVDATVTKDSEKVKRSKVRYPKLYEKERYPEEKVPEGAVAELGGGWFEGMAEGMSKKAAIVKYDVMRGRTDDVDGDDVDAAIEPQDELIVEVGDWKPHKQSEHQGLTWTDPKLNPRFKIDRKDPLAEGAPILSPKYDLLRARTMGAVTFDGRTGRVDVAVEDELMWEMDGMDAGDQGMALEAEEEHEHGRIKGWQSSSKNKKVIYGVDMKKQGVRKDIVKKSDAPDVIYDINYSALENRRGKGALDWAKEDDDLQGIDGDMNMPSLEVEELIVSPKRDKQSKYKKVLEAPAWSAQPAIVRPPLQKAPLGNQLQYDVESALDLTRPGSKVKIGVPMSRQIGRTVEDDLVDEGDPDLGRRAQEELELHPEDALETLRHVETVSSWSKEKNKRFDKDIPDNRSAIDTDKKFGADSKGGVVFSKQRGKSSPRVSLGTDFDEPDEGAVLQLDPTPLDPTLRALGGVGDFRKGVSYGNQDFLDSDDVAEGDVLRLSPSKISKKPQGMVSLKKQSGRPAPLIPDEDAEELIISPHYHSKDNMSNKGVVDWKRQDTGESNSKETALIMAALGVSAEELILSPYDPSKQRGSGKGTASWKKQSAIDDEDTNHMMTALGAGVEELILSPYDISKERGSGKGAAAWKKQSAINESDADHMMTSLGAGVDELILSPYDSSKKRGSGKGAASWKKQDTTARDTSANEEAVVMEHLVTSLEQLILSPYHTSKAKSPSKIDSSQQNPPHDVIPPKLHKHSKQKQLRFKDQSHQEEQGLPSEAPTPPSIQVPAPVGRIPTSHTRRRASGSKKDSF
eukprot:gene3189-6290_t